MEPTSAPVTATHRDGLLPRPTRPRSWWSWDSPKRSASRMTIMEASGTSTPTSMTVVDTRTGVAPEAKSAMEAALSSLLMRPVRTPTPIPSRAGSPSSRRLHSSTAASGRSGCEPSPSSASASCFGPSSVSTAAAPSIGVCRGSSSTSIRGHTT